MRLPIRSVAIVNPLPDYGISAYTYELAEGLAENGIIVDVYANEGSMVHYSSPPRRHRFMPILGSAIMRRSTHLDEASLRSVQKGRRSSRGNAIPLGALGSVLRRIRPIFLSMELAWHLKSHGYDLVWTQWPEMQMEGYSTRFWVLLKLFGIKVAHTVHNVLPHERTSGDESLCKAVYDNCDVLFVHSEYAANELERVFPGLKSRTVVARHGVYTLYPRFPMARAEWRHKFGLTSDERVLLFCGGVRPYKNIDGVLTALAKLRSNGIRLVVAGVESGYSEVEARDPLGRTRRLAEDLGLNTCVRFVPGFVSPEDLSALLEASDVLMLPYSQSYGSGLLLLGITFGKHIVATRTGGFEEYLNRYPRSTLLQSTQPEDIAAGIQDAVSQVVLNRQVEFADPTLNWSNIARRCLDEISSRLMRR